MRKSIQLGLSVLLLAACALLVHAQTAPVQYYYDDLGRLTTVVDQNGNVAAYHYDPVGNLLSITNTSLPSSNSLAVLNFTPQQGAIGQTVTIQGQGFSPTPGSNTVQFNGTAATVSAATANSITVNVPAGATTGPIHVTVTGTTATSSGNFTILQVPTVLSISPKYVVPGSTVTNFQVAGSNFTGATFSFSPAANPPAIIASGVSVSPDGSSATMTLTIASNATGSFVPIATSTAGTSTPIPSPSNTLSVLPSGADADGDGLTNIYELTIGTDPLNSMTNGDGIPDGWAVFYGISPLSPAAANQVAPDGLTYLQAYQQNLNPLIPTFVPPAVSGVFPNSGQTNYPTNGVIVLRFDEPLSAPASLTAAQNAINTALPPGSNLSSSDLATAAQDLQSYLLRTCCGGTAAVPGVVQVLQNGVPISGAVALSSDGLSLTFAPTRQLSSTTTYTVSAQGVMSQAGIPMTQSFQSTFTTGLSTNAAPLGATLTNPPNGTSGVPTNTPFMVQFSKQIDPATLTPQTFTVTDSFTGQVIPGMYQVDPFGFTASFVPQQPYGVGRDIEIALTSGIKDLTGNSLPSRFFFFVTGFAPDNQGPTLLGMSPSNATTAVPTNAHIDLGFDEPINPISALTGIQLQVGGIQVPAAVALSNGNKRITLTPQSVLVPTTAYTLVVNTQLTDIASVPVVNPSTFSFTTGAIPDATVPSVSSVSPLNAATGVPTNVVVQVQFSKPVDPFTVTTTAVQLSATTAQIPVPAAVSVSPDGRTATLTPTAPLQNFTTYFVQVSGIADLEGHNLPRAFLSNFVTGASAVTSPPTVSSISPTSGSTGVPVNAVIDIAMSSPLSIGSINNGAVLLSAGGSFVTGSITASSDLTKVTFKPNNLLGINTTYTVAVQGLTDEAGNVMAPFTSTFSTGSSGTPSTVRPTVVSVSPANGATAVPVGGPVTLTFNEPVDPSTVNYNTIQIGSTFQVSGSFAVSGNTVTFTPLAPFPGSAGVSVSVAFGGVLDFAGNSSNSFFSSFTTAAVVDTTPPQVVSVTPNNGMTGVGLNATVALTFSKPLNAYTLQSSALGLWANGSLLQTVTSTSPDNRVVTLTPSSSRLPASTTVAVIGTNGVRDLSGNSLVSFESQFTTAANFDVTHPFVVNQRPANGAQNVSLNSGVALYFNEPMNVSTLAGALHVSQNGTLVNGTVQITSNGQLLQFTPAAPFQQNAAVQVFMDSTAQDLDGQSLATYQTTFMTIGPSTVAPYVVNTSLRQSAGQGGTPKPPTNAIFDVGFNESLDPNTVNSTTVVLLDNSSNSVPSSISLVSGGTVVHVVPNSALAANSAYSLMVTIGLKAANGLPLASTQFPMGTIFTGAGPDTTPLTLLSVSPPNGAANVGDNAGLTFVSNKAIDPLAANASTIMLVPAGGGAPIPIAISFSSNYQTIHVAPQAPLPDSTQMTVTIAGVTDIAGNAMLGQTTSFTTGAGADFTNPVVLAQSPFANATDVPVNTAVAIQASKPIDPGTVNSSTFYLVDQLTKQNVTGTYSQSADGQTLYMLPAAPLAVGRTYSITFGGEADVTGNQLMCPSISSCSVSFTTGAVVDSTALQVIGVSPANGVAGVPINAQVVIQFSEPVDAATVKQVALASGGTTVNVTQKLTNANQTLVLVPIAPLAPNTGYTVSVAGVQDLGGNGLTNPATVGFTTGSGGDLTIGTVTSVSPANNSTSVPTNALIQLQFGKQVDPLTVTASDFFLATTSGTCVNCPAPVSGNISVSGDGLSATLTPSAPLLSSTNYYVWTTSGITDLEGQPVQIVNSNFTTGFGTASGPLTITTISPPNGASSVPLNALVQFVANAPLSPASVTSNAISVSAGTSPIVGTTSLSSDRTAITFTPSHTLSQSTAYSVNVGGITDWAGNLLAPISSGFTTGTLAATGLSATSIVPANGSTNAAVTSTITVTFNGLINPATVNESTFSVSVSGIGGYVAGTYQVNGRTATFTPMSPYPGNTTVSVSVNGVQDLAGNTANFFGSFTTAAVTDTAPPQVLLITPSNGASAVGLNAAVVLTFSKSLNPSTINTSTFALLAGGSRLNINISHSADNSVVTLSAGTLPPLSTVTVIATSGVRDLSGNALPMFQSQFTTAVALDSTHPAVISQRPSNGSTGVPVTAGIVVYVNEPMDSITIPGALHVSQNGVLVNGTTQVTDNGQVVQFTPAAPFQNNSLVQVFLDTTALDVDGQSVSSYQGSFTTGAAQGTNGLAIVNTNPAGNAVGVPTNAALEIGFNQSLDPTSVDSTSVHLYQNVCCTYPNVPSTLNLLNNGTVAQIIPNSPLASNGSYVMQTETWLRAANGNPAGFSASFYFTTGAGPLTTAPVVMTVSPPNGSLNVGDNASIRVVFSAPVNPLTANGTTIMVTPAGGVPIVPCSISFSNNNQIVLLVPCAPLPDDTQITIAISGVTDVAGNQVQAQSTQFTTGSGPDLLAPQVVGQSPPNSATNVPLNAPIVVQVNEPVDPGTVAGSTFFLQDFTGQAVAGSYSFSPDGQTVYFLPTVPLSAGHNYYVRFQSGVTNLVGSPVTCSPFCGSFTAGTAANTTAPQVVGVSPTGGMTAVPVNAQVAIQFSEPIDGLTLSQVTLSAGGVPANVAQKLSNGNQFLQLIPVLPLSANTTYTISIAGVQDLSGNALANPTTSTFTTGAVADLVTGAVASVTPVNGTTAIPTNSSIQVHFSKPVDALTVTTTNLYVATCYFCTPVPASLMVSPDGLAVTLTPNSPLAMSTSYTVGIKGNSILDLEGQGIPSFSSTFTTGTSTGQNTQSGNVQYAKLRRHEPDAAGLKDAFLGFAGHTPYCGEKCFLF